MKRKTLTRGLTLLLALAMLLVFAFSAMAVKKIDGPFNHHRPFKHCRPIHHCPPKPVITPVDACYLVVRILVNDAADVGKAFKFTYTLADGTKKTEVLAAALTSDKATMYKVSFAKGTTIDVAQFAKAGFTTTVNGAAGLSFSGVIKPGYNVVEFVNSRPVEDPSDLPGMG